jgi:uncharacterized protein (DUF1778 family)
MYQEFQETGMTTPSQRSDRLDIRISPEAKRMLQEAARERQTTISQFVIESALTTAQEVLAERTRIGLDSKQWAAFMAALDAPRSIIRAWSDCSKNRRFSTEHGGETPDRQACRLARFAGVRAMVVHAKDETAQQFYEHLGFVRFPEKPLTLYRLLKDIRAMRDS